MMLFGKVNFISWEVVAWCGRAQAPAPGLDAMLLWPRYDNYRTINEYITGGRSSSRSAAIGRVSGAVITYWFILLIIYIVLNCFKLF
jgi:hypothetical protein